jgi:hypothetical protein
MEEENPTDVYSPIQESDQSVRKLDNPGADYPPTQEIGDFWRCIQETGDC